MKRIALWTVFFALTGVASCDDGIDESMYDYRQEPGAEYLAHIQDLLEAMNMPRPVDAYCYPVYPGMAAWAELKDWEVIKAATQVPQSIVERQSTQGLLQDLWEYPLLGNISVFTFGYPLKPIVDSYFADNNAYKALQTRRDVADCLLKRMERVNPLAPADMFTTRAFEILIARDEMLSHFTSGQKRRMAKLTYDNFLIRGEAGASSPMLRSSLNLLSQIMLSSNYTLFVNELNRNEDLQNYMEYGTWIDTDNLKLIVICAIGYMNSPF